MLVPGGRICCVVGDVCIPRKRFGRHFVVPLHADIQVRARRLIKRHAPRLPVLQDPEAAEHVAHKHIALEDVWSPSLRRVGDNRLALGGTGPVHPDLAALPVEIAAQGAADVHDPQAALVIGDVERLVVDPEVVRTRLGYLVFGDLFGIVDVGHVDHVDVSAHAVRRADLVAEEDVVTIPPRHVRVALGTAGVSGV